MRRLGLSLAVAAAGLPALWGCSREGPPPPPPASKPAEQAPPPRNTLASIPNLPRLYDGDTTDLLPRYAEKLKAGSRDGVHFAIQQLGMHGDASVPAILRVLEPLLGDDQGFGPITNCCQALNLTKTRDPRALAVLRKFLSHKSGSASSEAARTLGYLRDPSSLPALRDAFPGASVELRRVLIKAMGNLEGPEAAAALYELAADETLPIGFRNDAVDALAIRAVASSEAEIRKLLPFPRPIAEKATIGLVATRDPERIAAASALARQWKDPALRVLASLASAALACEGFIEPALSALEETDPEIRLGIGLVGLRNALANAKPGPELRAKIVAALRRAEAYPERESNGGVDPKNPFRLEALRILVFAGEAPTIDRDLEDLASSDPKRVSDAITVLTDPQVIDRRATPLLLRKLEEAPFSRKRGYMQALGRLRDPRAVPAIAKSLLGEGDYSDGSWLYEYAALQLANFGDAGIDALVEALAKTKDPARRRAIVQGISHGEPAKGTPILRRIAEDTSEDRETRAVAIRILPDLEKDAAASFLKRLLASEPDEAIRRLLNFTLFDRY